MILLIQEDVANADFLKWQNHLLHETEHNLHSLCSHN